jgi:four helix bundle protein
MESTTAGIEGGAVPIDCDRLDVYRVAREFDALAVRALPGRGHAHLTGQLLRASSSTVLNIAEGCGRLSPSEKAHFYLIARGSAMECAAVFDLALSRGLVSDSDHRRARGLLARIVQMLTRLAVRLRR